MSDIFVNPGEGSAAQNSIIAMEEEIAKAIIELLRQWLKKDKEVDELAPNFDEYDNQKIAATALYAVETYGVEQPDGSRRFEAEGYSIEMIRADELGNVYYIRDRQDNELFCFQATQEDAQQLVAQIAEGLSQQGIAATEPIEIQQIARFADELTHQQTVDLIQVETISPERTEPKRVATKFADGLTPQERDELMQWQMDQYGDDFNQWEVEPELEQFETESERLEPPQTALIPTYAVGNSQWAVEPEPEKIEPPPTDSIPTYAVGDFEKIAASAERLVQQPENPQANSIRVYKAESYSITADGDDYSIKGADDSEIFRFRKESDGYVILSDRMSAEQKQDFLKAYDEIHKAGGLEKLKKEPLSTQIDALGELAPAGSRAIEVADNILTGTSQNDYQGAKYRFKKGNGQELSIRNQYDIEIVKRNAQGNINAQLSTADTEYFKGLYNSDRFKALKTHVGEHQSVGARSGKSSQLER
jgi:hypothetical protein